MARSLLPSDSINRLGELLRQSTDSESGHIQLERDGVVDAVEEILLYAYIYGVKNVGSALGIDIPADPDEAAIAIMREYDGKNFADRVREYFDDDDIDGILRVADTDAHRAFNAGGYNTAVKGGATKKTWFTMLDEKVRDMHVALEGITVPIDGTFFAQDGDEGQYPGDFQKPQNNVNCRCGLIFS